MWLYNYLVKHFDLWVSCTPPLFKNQQTNVLKPSTERRSQILRDSQAYRGVGSKRGKMLALSPQKSGDPLQRPLAAAYQVPPVVVSLHPVEKMPQELACHHASELQALLTSGALKPLLLSPLED